MNAARQSMTSTVLLAALLDPQNEDIWLEFDARYRPILMGMIRRPAVPPSDAADLAQDTLLTFFQEYRSGKYERARGRLRSWLIALVRRHVALYHRRRAGRQVQPLTAELAQLPDEHFEQLWEAQRKAELLRQALLELRDATRITDRTLRAFDLYVVQRQSAKDVWLSSLKSPCGTRVVALKTMRAGIADDPRDTARFQREVSLLAQLNHPDIITIHDSGAAAGFRYYVMDLVQGANLAEHVQQARQELHGQPRLFLRRCVELLARLAEAMNAAHVKGIIHRDLKPSNVRVSADGAPKVLDFGLAKLVPEHAARLSEQDDLTHTGHFLGSLPWASPEQAEGRIAEVDTRSDVYALGAIAYQLLTGRLPIEPQGNIRLTLDRIATAEPPAPRAINPAIDLDLQTIVLKCLRKQAERRYQTAGELARDLRHWLAGRPIDARRDSTIYVLSKTIARHKLAFGAAAAFVALLLGSTIALAALSRSQTVARLAADKARAEAESQQGMAMRQTAKFQAVNSFLQSDLLSAVDPNTAQGRTVTVEEVLDDSVRRLDACAVTEPDVEAEVRATIGQMYQQLARHEPAETQVRKAIALRQELDPSQERPEHLADLNRLGLILKARGSGAEARALAGEALRLARQLYAPPHKELVRAIQALAVNLQGTDPVQSEALSREALVMLDEVGDDGALRAGVLTDLAWFLRGRDRPVEATVAAEAAVAIRRRLHTTDHNQLTLSINNLASIKEWQNDFASAETLARETLGMMERLYPRAHPDLAAAYSNHALYLRRLKRPAEAEAQARKAYNMWRNSYPGDHSDIALGAKILAQALEELNELEEATALAAESVAMNRRLAPAPNVLLGSPLVMLARLTQKAGDLHAAEAFAREAAAVYEQTLPSGHPGQASVLAVLGDICLWQGNLAEAEQIFCRALEISLNSASPNRQSAGKLHALLAQVYTAQGRQQDADAVVAASP